MGLLRAPPILARLLFLALLFVRRYFIVALHVARARHNCLRVSFCQARDALWIAERVRQDPPAPCLTPHSLVRPRVDAYLELIAKKVNKQHQRRLNEDLHSFTILRCHDGGLLDLPADNVSSHTWIQSSFDGPPSQLNAIFSWRAIGRITGAVLEAGDTRVLGLSAVSERIHMVQSARVGRDGSLHARRICRGERACP